MTDSIQQRLPRLIVAIEDFGGAHDQNDPLRHAKWRTKNAAWAALEGGMRAAAEILEAGEAFIRDAPRPSPAQ